MILSRKKADKSAFARFPTRIYYIPPKHFITAGFLKLDSPHSDPLQKRFTVGDHHQSNLPFFDFL